MNMVLRILILSPTTGVPCCFSILPYNVFFFFNEHINKNTIFKVVLSHGDNFPHFNVFSASDLRAGTQCTRTKDSYTYHIHFFA